VCAGPAPQARREFIDPLFEALGWDAHNRRGFAEQFKRVVHEDTIRIGGAQPGRERGVLERQIAPTDEVVDRLVYELYELTDEEIAIVEESVKT
jgi:hypothetical protein